MIKQRKLVLSDPCRWVEQCLSLLLCLVRTTQPLMKNWNSDKKASKWRQFFIVCPLIDDKMKSQFVKELWIHIKLCQRYDVILSLVRGQTIKNWHQFAFYNNKSSKKKNIAVKNEENTKKFMTFFKNNAMSLSITFLVWWLGTMTSNGRLAKTLTSLPFIN